MTMSNGETGNRPDSGEGAPKALLSRRGLLKAAGGLALAGTLGGTAACGSNTGRESSSGSGPVLNQWYHQYGEAGTKDAVEKFAKAYTKAQVKVGWFPGDYDSKISSGLLGSDGPDVFEWHFNAQLAKANQVVPLDDILADYKSDLGEGDIAANTYEGKMYGVPMIGDPQLFFYRKSMLEKAGITPPKTFDELIAASKALTTKDVKGLFIGNDNGAGWAGDALLASTGQRHLTADHKISFNTDATIEALLKMRELVNSKTMLAGAPTDWWDPTAFNQGLCAMTRNGLWALPGMKKVLGDDIGVFPVPAVGATGKQAIFLGGWTAFVSAKSKNVDAAKAYVKWLYLDKTEYQEEWALDYGFHIPPRKSLAAKAEKLQSGLAAEILKLTNEHAWSDDPFWTQAMRTAYKDMASNVVIKGADPKAEMAKCVTRVEAELQKLA